MERPRKIEKNQQKSENSLNISQKTSRKSVSNLKIKFKSKKYM